MVRRLPPRDSKGRFRKPKPNRDKTLGRGWRQKQRRRRR